MLPEGSIDKTFDYVVPAADEARAEVGMMVRISLHGRRAGAWIVEVDVEPPPGVTLKPIAKISSHGPPANLVDLAGWAAWRWAGRRANFLRTASPPAVVRAIPAPVRPKLDVVDVDDALLVEALLESTAVLRLPPGADRYPLVLAAAAAPGNALVLCPTVAEAVALAGRLRRDGLPVACVAYEKPGSAAAAEWARAAAGATVVGTRAGAWAPVADLSRVVVLDEHDESYQGEQAPTWHARDVAIERARRAGVPCVLVSPCPTLEALSWGRLIAPSRNVERHGWPALSIVDRRMEDPVTAGLYSTALVDLLRSPGRVVCVINRVGRSRLLGCAVCGELARCEVCSAAVMQDASTEQLVCRRCDASRPVICDHCGSMKLKNIRAGVSRVAEELSALVGEPVDEVTAASEGAPQTRVVVGTTAVLNRIGSAAVVAFLDIDQDLTAPRYRANEQALAVLARGARLVRGRSTHGRLLVQTRQPDHLVLQAALHGDPQRVATAELPLRKALGLPPAKALAIVSGAVAEQFVASLADRREVTVQGPADGAWRIRGEDHQALCGALAATPRPTGRLRIEVDPLGI